MLITVVRKGELFSPYCCLFQTGVAHLSWDSILHIIVYLVLKLNECIISKYNHTNKTEFYAGTMLWHSYLTASVAVVVLLVQIIVKFCVLNTRMHDVRPSGISPQYRVTDSRNSYPKRKQRQSERITLIV